MNPYTNGYKNARDVLPERILRKLQDVYIGLVWVPGSNKKKVKEIGKAERNRKMIELYSNGKSIKALANEFFLSAERVRQIIKGGLQNGSQG